VQLRLVDRDRDLHHGSSVFVGFVSGTTVRVLYSYGRFSLSLFPIQGSHLDLNSAGHLS
jgi:hypothetical protein